MCLLRRSYYHRAIIIIMMSYHLYINDQDDLVATLGSSQNNNYKSFLICCDNRAVVVTSIERLDRILGSPIRESKIRSRANMCSKLCGQTFIERGKCRLYRWKPRRVVCLQTISYFRLSYLCTNNTGYSSYILQYRRRCRHTEYNMLYTGRTRHYHNIIMQQNACAYGRRYIGLGVRLDGVLNKCDLLPTLYIIVIIY